MAYDEHLAERIELVLHRMNAHFYTKHMFGGVAFMVDDKMCLGVTRNDLMARVGPELEEEALKQIGARPMDFTGRPMKGYVHVSPDGVDTEEDLEKWVRWCLEFNPKAKASSKRKK